MVNSVFALPSFSHDSGANLSGTKRLSCQARRPGGCSPETGCLALLSDSKVAVS